MVLMHDGIGPGALRADCRADGPARRAAAATAAARGLAPGPLAPAAPCRPEDRRAAPAARDAATARRSPRSAMRLLERAGALAADRCPPG